MASSFLFTIDSTTTATEMGKSYHTKATGAALETVGKHGEDEQLKLFGSCFWYNGPN